jgi:hypothetical protein
MGATAGAILRLLFFVITSVALTLAAALGCWIPERRAIRVDAMVTPRHE